MSYSTDLRGEGGSLLIPEGWNIHMITDIVGQVSKSSGNPMYVMTIEEPNSGSVDVVYMVDVKGKRFMLKQLLAACGVQENKDGVVEWSEEDVVGKSIECRNVPEDNEFTRKDGTVVKEKRNKIQGIRRVTGKATV